MRGGPERRRRQSRIRPGWNASDGASRVRVRAVNYQVSTPGRTFSSVDHRFCRGLIFFSSTRLRAGSAWVRVGPSRAERHPGPLARVWYRVSGSLGSRVKPETSEFTRRRLLRDAMTIVGAVAAGAVPLPAFARQRGNADAGGAVVDNTLALARAVNAMHYEDLPARAVEHAKMIWPARSQRRAGSADRLGSHSS